MNPAELFSTISRLKKLGRTGQALPLLRDALQRGRLTPEETDRAGRFLQKAFEAGLGEGKPIHVLLLGQCTTSWLSTALTAVAFAHDVVVSATDGSYDNVLQELTSLESGKGHPDVVVLVPWTQRLPSDGRALGPAIEDEFSLWRRAWQIVRDGLGARLLQVGYDWVTPGPLGGHLSGGAGGHVDLIRHLNQAIRQELPAGSFFVDLDQVSGLHGRRSFYDMRRYHWTKQPFSESGTCCLAEHLWAGVRALTSGPMKVLVLDLDNTIWGGVVGETGPLGVVLDDGADGSAFLAFQRHVKDLSRRGVILAVASKNNLSDAREPFETNPNMVLQLGDIAAFEASWEPKDTMIRRISEELRLGLDSFVFFDENPAEAEQVRQALPEVHVVAVPADPADYPAALQAGLWFEAVALTAEDELRSTRYAEERGRRDQQRAFSSLDEYLRSLEMTAQVRPVEPATLPRVVQLLAKTNQFNLTTRRHTHDDVTRLLESPGAIALTLHVQDRFGDHGLVAVLIAVPCGPSSEGTLRIDTWLMSCRVIGRTVEQGFFAAFLGRCQRNGLRRIVGEYIPTKKSALVADLYETLGFARSGNPDEGGAVRFFLDVRAAEPPKTFLAVQD